MSDPTNPVMKMCIDGMQAELEGRADDARILFLRGWDARRDAFDACIAAHYLARHQDTPEDALRWNQEALSQAELAGADRVRGFYPSLYLNLGHSHEVLGDRASARRYYDVAAALVGDLADDRYGEIVRRGIAEGRRRVAADL
ncbi:MAG: hypothetical protein M3081_13470 [Gemmatimonadota bacterium]|nr:hypothetical protein [Gemmatimonadota bacterium]